MEVVMFSQTHFPVVIQQDEDGVYILTCPIFSGCHSYGHSIEEGMANITEAIEACVEDEIDEPLVQFVGVRDVQLAI
jgi:predicted RNase H-like HicB family nuclease